MNMVHFTVYHLFVITLVAGIENSQSGFPSSIGARCRIPHGICMLQDNCVTYLKLYGSSLSNDQIKFTGELICGRGYYPAIVCCPIIANQYGNANIPSNLHHNANKLTGNHNLNDIGIVDRFADGQITHNAELLPSECGANIQYDNRIFGGDPASLWEFPWMVLLQYNADSRGMNGIGQFGCGGALISKRYVLTAGHCVSSSTLQSKRGLKSVHLGEYNTESQPDCTLLDARTHKFACADPVVELGVERIIVHPWFSDASSIKHHDIAMLRLDADVTYSKYIKPICLPVDDRSSGLIVGNNLTVSGWGRTNVFQRDGHVLYRSSPVKLKVQLPIIDCADAYAAYNLDSGQICAGGERNKDSCFGDSGGPLMYFDARQNTWFASGIVSFGAIQCGTPGVPGVYTKVHHYINWIYSNLEQ